jgi:hypothetical protein
MTVSKCVCVLCVTLCHFVCMYETMHVCGYVCGSVHVCVRVWKCACACKTLSLWVCKTVRVWLQAEEIMEVVEANNLEFGVCVGVGVRA